MSWRRSVQDAFWAWGTPVLSHFFALVLGGVAVGFFVTLREPDAVSYEVASLTLAQYVMGVLGSFLLVSKVREWCVSVDTGKLDSIKGDVDRVIEEAWKSTLKSEAERRVEKAYYEESKKRVEGLFHEMKRGDAFFFSFTYAAVLVCAVMDFLLLARGGYKDCGGWVLLLLLPLPVARGWSWLRVKQVDKELADIKGEFQDKVKMCQPECEKEEGGVFGVFDKIS